MDWIAKCLFPNHNRDLRRKEMRALMRVVLFTLLLSIAFAITLYFMSRGKR